MLFQRMRYFVAVADCNSFTEAAEQCFISQSAISQQIAALEDDFGVRLIVREGRKFRLTPAGEYFYQRSKAVLAEVEEAKAETQRLGRDEEMRLNVGYPAAYDGAELQSALLEFSHVYPEALVGVFRGTHEELYEALKAGRASLVLSDQRRAFSDEYENFVLDRRPAAVDLSPRHPLAGRAYVTTAELEGEPCIFVAAKDAEQAERDFYGGTLGVGKQFLFAASLDEARLTAMGGRSFLLVESARRDPAPLVRSELRRADGSPIVRTYCAFWLKKRSNYYIEEFTGILRKYYTVRS